MSDLETAINALVNRLDVVTSRLEKLEKGLASGVHSSSANSNSSAPAVDDSELPPSVAEWDELVEKYIPQYVELSNRLGDKDVIAQAKLLHEVVTLERAVLVTASKAKKPSDSQLGSIVGPTGQKLGEVKELREKQTKSHKFYNHLSAISEGVDAMQWVVVAPKPGPHVAEAKNQAQFYSNKILQEFKGKDQNHVDWVGTFVGGFLKDLQDYIKKYHTTGLTWNAKGVDASSVKVESAPASHSKVESDDSSPPPPPGPAPDFHYDFGTSAPSKQGGAQGLFAEINQKGEGVSTGLKHVTKDMKTKYRDPNDKSGIAPKEKSTASTGSYANKNNNTPSKPPKLALEGNKWSVEYQVNDKNLVISETETKHTVYFYKSKNSALVVKGKVNAITMDDCEKCAVVFENCIASVEVVNCKSIEIQVLGKVPSFAIDKTSGVQLYLSKDALEAEIVSSKSDSMNVLIPTSDGDFEESPIPEQYKTTVKNGKLVTEISSHV